MDSVYENLCSIIKTELHNTVPLLGATRSTNKRLRPRKPFWDDNLQRLWDIMRRNEEDFLKCKHNRRLRFQLRTEYVKSRNEFDKHLRRTERAFKRATVTDIEEMSTNNPNEFWRKIEKLGPKRDKSIPVEIIYENGAVSNDESVVFERWKNDFYNLYNCSDNNDFDDVYFDRAKLHKVLLENNISDHLYESNSELNSNVTIEEVALIVRKAKCGSASGIDELPYDVVKNPAVICALQQLFQLIFDTSLIPSIWRKSVICPILKDPKSDKRVPMNYRGISLLACISKLYTSFLNKRLTGYLENNDILADEQNGFRADRSCEDHVFTLNSVVKNNKEVFTAYIDLKRCFDYINRDMLLYKLLLNGIDDKLYNSIKNIYTSSVSTVRINNKLTEWFSCNSGVKQGCNLSPTLFAIFANDLVNEINGLDLGFDIGDRKLSLLLYADDIVMMAKTEEDLQTMLDTLYSWCKRWRVLINAGKSKCMHFRKGRKQRSTFEFKVGNDILETVDRYRYLGVIFQEKCDYTFNCEALAKGAGRALGGIISKIHNLRDLGFKSFDKLFHSCVSPIMDYCSSVWGVKRHQSLENVQHRAMRYFLGVHRFTPILAMVGDTGWLPSIYRRWRSMIRLWNRLILMNNERLTKKVFNADLVLHNSSKNWSSEINQVMNDIGLSDQFESKSVIYLSKVTNT